MREFLFRGKVKEIGNWVEGDLIHGGQPLISMPNGLWYIVDPDTVSQSTGFYDMVTNEPIFEGDIVEDIAGHCGVVEWRQDEAAYIIKFSESYEEEMCFKYEVVGNKWDNPELLEHK